MIANRSPVAGRSSFKAFAAQNSSCSDCTRNIPTRRKAASYTASIWREAGSPPRPARTTRTGLIRAAARAADRNLRALVSVSRDSRMAWVSGSQASQSNRSLKSRSARSPSAIALEKPMPWGVAHSSAEASTAPDWAISAQWPGAGSGSLSEAFRPQRGMTTPRLFGPSRRIP